MVDSGGGRRGDPVGAARVYLAAGATFGSTRPKRTRQPAVPVALRTPQAGQLQLVDVPVEEAERPVDDAELVVEIIERWVADADG
jgi:hypothetical protein